MPRAVIGYLHELQCRLIIRCEGCGHEVVLTASEAVAKFGWRTRVADVRPKLKCVTCGARARDGKVVMGLDADDSRAADRREGLGGMEGRKSRSPASKYPQGTRHNRMQWMKTLADMKACGTRLFSTCSDCTKYHEELDLDQLISLYGPETDLWDRWSECPTAGCSGKAFFMATPGRGTPLRPLKTSEVMFPWIGEAVELRGLAG